jgi:hypothetical protein
MMPSAKVRGTENRRNKRVRVTDRDANQSHEVVHRIRNTLAVLLEPSQVVELHIPNTRKATVSGYFNDPDKLARVAATWDGQAAGVYVTLNPVSTDLLARAANRTVDYAKHTTADRDITSRQWLPIDFDAVRPSGISSTDEEHEAALDRVRQC